ncbi:hypothetical protein FACS1894129_1480 [Actinomycetota bacterium]|nr:hypothetical protein FACS1894129_1480 [Actinomycetota bacterium]
MVATAQGAANKIVDHIAIAAAHGTATHTAVHATIVLFIENLSKKLNMLELFKVFTYFFAHIHELTFILEIVHLERMLE